MSNSRRKLTRAMKDVVYVRQCGQCAFCLNALHESFQVDHLNSNATDDRFSNLVATCGTCHNEKSLHFSKQRHDQVESMIEEAVRNRDELMRNHILSGRSLHWPQWIRARVPKTTLCLMDALAQDNMTLP